MVVNTFGKKRRVRGTSMGHVDMRWLEDAVSVGAMSMLNGSHGVCAVVDILVLPVICQFDISGIAEHGRCSHSTVVGETDTMSWACAPEHM